MPWHALPNDHPGRAADYNQIRPWTTHWSSAAWC